MLCTHVLNLYGTRVLNLFAILTDVTHSPPGTALLLPEVAA